MKKIYVFVASLLLSTLAFGATFNLFTPVTGVLKGNASTYVTTAAASTDIYSLWSGTCNSTTYLRGDGQCQAPPGAGGGTVNSVGLSAPSVFSVGGSPVTTTGTLALTFAGGQTANQFLASPDGTTGAITLRSMVAADIPTLDLVTKTTTTVTGLLKGTGSGAPSAYAGTSCTNQFPRSLNASGVATCASVSMTADVTGITPAANGGTANGFTAFSGPATSTKTFTLPNASATVLTDNAAVTVAQGGTGVATLTGIAKGNGTSAFTAAASSDVISTWGGTCSASTYLRGDGSCQTPATGGTSANPSATIGLTAVNGSAGTFLRSDGAPALSQSIAPTWTAVHTFSQVYGASNTEALQLGSSLPAALYKETDAAADTQKWVSYVNSGVLHNSILNDAETTEKSWTTITRSTNAVSNLSFGNATDNPTYTFAGTGTATFGGDITLSGNRTISSQTTSGVAAGAYLFKNSAGATKSGIGSYFNTADEGDLEFIGPGGVTTAKISSSGNFLINAPSSGTALTVNGLVGADSSPISMTGRGFTTNFTFDTSGTFFNFAGAQTWRVYSNAGQALNMSSAGNFTINAPSSGTGLAVNAVNASTAALDIASGNLKIAGSAGTSGQVLTSGGPSAAPSWTTLASASSGSFTATATGMSGTTTGTLKYNLSNGIVVLYADGTALSGTSNTTGLTITGLPAAIQPANQRTVLTYSTNNGTSTVSQADVLSGSVTFSLCSSLTACSASGYTSSGAKGVSLAWSITYPL